MARGRKQTPEKVVGLLWQIEVGTANGKTSAIACKEAGIIEQTYYRWRKEYGGLQVNQDQLRHQSLQLACLFAADSVVIANDPPVPRPVLKSDARGSESLREAVADDQCLAV